LLHLCPTLGKASSLKYIKPFMKSILKDENKIKIKLFENLEPVNKVIPISSLLPILQPVLNELLKDSDWKIRQKAVQSLPVIFLKIEEEMTFSEDLNSPLQTLLTDKVYSVRKAAIVVIKRISKKLGVKWSEKKALAMFKNLFENQNYLYRINYLFGVGEIYKYISSGILEKELANICKMVKDPVPNIRATVIKTLLRIYLGK